MKGTNPIGSRWLVGEVPHWTAQSLPPSGLPTGRYGTFQRALSPAWGNSTARILKHDAQTNTRSFELQSSFRHTAFSLLSAALIISSRATVLSSLTSPPWHFLPPQRGVILPSVTSSPFLPTNLKSWNMLQHTWLGVICSKDLASLSQAVSGTQRSILDLFSSLLLKNSILCLCPSSSTPLGQQDTSLHDVTHWPQALTHVSVPYSLFYFSFSPSAVFISHFQDPKHTPALITPDILLHSWLSSFHPGVLVDFMLLEKLALLNLKILTSTCLL